MSQKYKNFTKSCCQTSDCVSTLPEDVKRVGYLRKLKKLKRRFFVLHMDSDSGAARFEYYSSEKKWRLGGEPRRCIELKSCLNISRKLHSKQKNVIALYTQNDCFSVVAESADELEQWLNDILEVQKACIAGDENVKGKIPYEHLWQVVIDRHDLECSQNLMGPYCVALSPKALTLIKMNPSSDNDYFEFPEFKFNLVYLRSAFQRANKYQTVPYKICFQLMSIRRCGHSKDHFFIELGRSAVTGAGEIYMATEATIIAQNMHETVLSAMKSSKIREDGNPLPRPRSASTSENINPVATRRPIGIVVPQSVTSTSNSVLCNSRERCDSLPTRPKTLSENPHNCILSALSSPYSSSGITCSRLTSRPHSMYEWSSLNSPSSKNSCFSPSSLSSTTGYASSTEDIDTVRSHSSCFFSHNKSLDGILSSDRPITEVPDEYLVMSPVEGSSVKKMDSYMPMAPGGVSENKPVVMQEGYLDMSPTSNSFPSRIEQNVNVERNKNCCLDQSVRNEIDSFVLEKVAAETKGFLYDDKEEKNKASSSAEIKLAAYNSSSEAKQVEYNSCMNFHASKPPVPEKSYCKVEYQNNIGPPLPPRRNEFSTTSLVQQQNAPDNCIMKNENCEARKAESDSSYNIQEVCDLKETSIENEILKNVMPSKSSSLNQNTNFNCLVHHERPNHTSPCTLLYSVNKYHDNKLTAVYNQIESLADQKHDKALNVEKFCSDSKLQVCSNSSGSEHCSECHVSNSFSYLNSNVNYLGDVDTVSCTCGDYVNLEFKKCSNVNTCQNNSSNSVLKNNFHALPCVASPADTNYTNIHFGKPYCPIPNPIPATHETNLSLHNSIKSERTCQNFFQNSSVVSTTSSEDTRIQKGELSSPCLSVDSQKSALLSSRPRNVPTVFPAFRKQMSAPCVPPSLKAELLSPGRKSSCPVTASASMVKPSLPTTAVSSVGPVLLQSHVTSVHLRVSSSRSPDHSSISSISSASDEVSSNHSSPKTVTLSQNFETLSHQNVSECQYENVVIPQRPPSMNGDKCEKELNYASLDLTPSARDNIPRSPVIQKPLNTENVGSLTYAEIDFTKSEGLKSISGNMRESRL